MNEFQKTLAFVGVALVLTGAAYLTRPTRLETAAAFVDQGEKFFPEFDPLTATSLEVVDYDTATASVIPFKVELDVASGTGGGKKRWVIPSHYDYPADAKDRLSRTASGIYGLRKDTIRSDRAEDHEALGVVDPLDTKTTTLKGRGKHVTLRDASGKTLADLIVGKEVPGQAGQRYVRLPGKDRTYGVKIDVDLSARFADWIEPNLLKLQADGVRRLVFDNHKVDPEAGRIIPGEVLTVARKDASGPWTLEGLGPDQEVNTEKLSGATTALADLKIVGVRPMPESLIRDIQSSAEGKVSPTTNETVRSLVSKGFYPVRGGGLYSNQGEVRVGTDEGVVYHLRFGEVTFAQGEALSAGTDEAAAEGKAAQAPDQKKPGEGSTVSRYLFVTVDFDPGLIPEPTPPAPAEGPAKLPENVFTPTPEERAAREKADKEKQDRETAERERKLTEGKNHVGELAARFAGWYYVTPGDSFRSIALDRSSLVRKKGETPEPPPGGGLPPGMFSPGGAGPRFPGLPPGHP
jgi:hypothetical protein